MWPWGHLAVGYLLYATYRRYWIDRVPDGWPVVALAVGAIAPDLVDKPLTYSIGILPAGRSLAHSMLVVVVVVFACIWTARRMGVEEVGVAFAIGYASHPFADGLEPVVQGDWPALAFLAWPLVPSPPDDVRSFAHHLQELMAAIEGLQLETFLTPWTDLFVLELWLVGVVAAVWLSHGAPPVNTLGGRR